MIPAPLLSLLRCPVDGSPLVEDGDSLVSAAGNQYPVVEGVPVLLRPDASGDTLECIRAGREAIKQGRRDHLYVDAVGCSDDERQGILKLAAEGSAVDPVVNYMVAATSGIMYRHLIGKLKEYPIPYFRLKNGNGRVLVDLGCNWGRWCAAAAKEGFQPLGVEPQIGAVLAAKRVARDLGNNAWFVCADARHLPLAPASVDVGFSYSVFQHLSHEDVKLVLKGLAKALKPGGESLIQMATRAGLKGLVHSARNGFKKPEGFDVRYWTRAELREAFEACIGPSDFSVDCFFGLGLQAADGRLMPPVFKVAISLSESLRSLSNHLPGLTSLADSVYVHSRKTS